MFQTPQFPNLRRQKTTTKKTPGKTTNKTPGKTTRKTTRRKTTTRKTVKTTRGTKKTTTKTAQKHDTFKTTIKHGPAIFEKIEVSFYGRNHLAMWGRKALYIYLVSILSLMGIFYFYVIRLIYEKQNRLQVRLTSFVNYYITSFTGRGEYY